MALPTTFEHVATRSVQELAQEMVDEIEQGIDGTELKADHREIAQRRKITPLEEGLPPRWHITRPTPDSTHTSFSTMGWSNGLLSPRSDPRVTVGHAIERQPRQHFEDDRSGAYVQFDTIGKNSYYRRAYCDASSLRDRGLLNRVMLSMDTRRSHLKPTVVMADYLLTTLFRNCASQIQSGRCGCDVRENPNFP
ncbi:hypothetical protein [Klebsiella pneumoniae]|uniref:phosphotriesterase family protein n=1 Tax=Klebsiella pneumoniae TaxID=573 RepID=UPI00388DC714